MNINIKNVDCSQWLSINDEFYHMTATAKKQSNVNFTKVEI